MTQTVKNKLQSRGYIISAILFVTGALIYFFAPGFSFSGLVLMGCSLLLIAFLTAVWMQKRKPHLGKVLLIALSFLTGFGFLAAIITGIFIYRAGVGNASADCAYVVVLGAGVNGSIPSLSLQNRIDAAYAYLSAHPDSIAIVSGGQGNGEDISEAQCMQQELIRMGIPQHRVWQEDKASTTRENIGFSLDLIESRTGSRPGEIGLITSEYHEFRAGFFAKQEGVSAISIPAKTSWLSLKINYFLREIFAVWYYIILGG